MTSIGSNPWVPLGYINNGAISDPTNALLVANAASADAANLPPTETGIFQSLVQHDADLVGTPSKPPTDVAGTLQKLENMAASIVSFEELAQNPMALQAILVETTYQQQESAIREANQAAQLQIADAFLQAAEDQQGAAALASDALTSLIVTVVGSAVEMIGATIGVVGAASNLKSLNDMTEEGDDSVSNVFQNTETSSENHPSKIGGSTAGDSTIGVDDDSNIAGNNNDPVDGGSDEPPADGGGSVNGSNSNKDPIGDAKRAKAAQDARDFKLEKIRTEGAYYQALQSLFQAFGQTFSAGGSYMNSMGQAENQTDQAAGQEYSADASEEQQIYNIAEGIVQSLASFVDAMEGSLQTVATAQAGLSQGVSNARANI